MRISEHFNYFIILCPHKLQRVYKITVGREEKNLSLYRIIQVYEVIDESSSGELKVILVWL